MVMNDASCGQASGAVFGGRRVVRRVLFIAAFYAHTIVAVPTEFAHGWDAGAEPSPSRRRLWLH